MNRPKMRLLLTAGILIFLSACSDVKNDQPDISRMLKQEPFRGITDSIERSPEDPELRLRRATLLSQNNQFPMAGADYKKAWELTGDESVALLYASNLLLSNKVDAAIAILQEGATKFPENTEFNRRLGEIHFQKEEYKKALAQYDLMLAKDSGSFEAWFDKGSLLAKLKDTNEAIACMETSFSLLPINYSGIALANLYVARKDPRALEVCNILLSRDSSGTQTDPVYMKGMYYSEVREYDSALREFDECIRRDWKMTDAYIEKGIILFERKNIPGALKIFSMATTVSNTDADAYYWMGRCYESSGDKEKAVVNYQRAVALDNSFTEARTAIHRLNG